MEAIFKDMLTDTESTEWNFLKDEREEYLIKLQAVGKSSNDPDVEYLVRSPFLYPGFDPSRKDELFFSDFFYMVMLLQKMSVVRSLNPFSSYAVPPSSAPRPGNMPSPNQVRSSPRLPPSTALELVNARLHRSS